MKIEINVPDGVSGDWTVKTFEVSEQESKATSLRAAFHGYNEYVPPGVYKKLTCRGEVVMSNTPMEIRTHWEIIHKAKGAVLLNGLGLGVCLKAILEKPGVTSVTVIEKSKDVINLVAGTYANDPRVKIIEADALEYKPAKGQRFDCVWHDIWTYICADNLEEMKKLHRKYGKKCDWQGSWERYRCEMGR